MKWLSFFEKNEPPPVADVKKVGSSMVLIKSINFFGSYSESPNGKYIVTCQDSDHSRGVGGYRTKGNGRFALVELSNILFLKECQRPNDGKVSNNGTVIISDWLFGDELGSTLLVYDITGQRILEHRFTANAFNNGISPDGQFAAVQLCNSDTEDANSLFLFNLNSKSLISKFKPQTGWADSYNFDIEYKTVSLCYRNGRSYRYSFDGTFLDSARYQTERVEDASATELVLIVQEMLKKSESALPYDLLGLLDRAFSQKLSEYPDYLAIAYRLRGELYEAVGLPRKAIDAYREALGLDPKIGIKKRLGKLEKETPANPERSQQ
jgi:hypothetical protein